MSSAIKLMQSAGVGGTNLEWYALRPDSGATYDDVAIDMGSAVFDEANNLYVAYINNGNQNSQGLMSGVTDACIMSIDTSDFSVNWNRQYSAASFGRNTIVWSEVYNRLYAISKFSSTSNNIDFCIINPSDGNEIDSDTFADSTSTYYPELYAGAVRPSDGHCIPVGRLRNQSATNDHKGIHMEVYGSSSITKSTSYTFENSGDDIALGSIEWSENDQDFYAYGIADASTFSASRINSTGSPSGSAYIYTVSTIPISDVGGAYVLAIDDSGNRFVLHISDDTDATYSVLTCFDSAALNDTSPAWSVRLDYTIGLRATGCLGADGNLYIATNNGTLIQVDTSDGSLLNAMYIPSPIIWDGYEDDALKPLSLGEAEYGTITSINSNDSKIYITFSGSFVASSMHGNILVIPEEDFGEEFLLEGGSGLLTYEGATHTTVTPTYSYTAISNTSETINATTITNTDSAVGVPNSLSTVEKGSSPIIIPLSRDHESGGTSTNTVNLPDSIEANYLSVELKENDVVVYISVCATNNGDSTSSNLVTTTSGYTTITSLDEAVNNGSCMVVGWKRMGSTPDTSIALPESQVSTNGQAYLMFLIRGLSSDADVIDSFTTDQGSSITAGVGFPAITPTGNSFVVTVGAMGYGGTRYVSSPTDIDAGDYDSLVNFSGNVQGSDTRDCSAFYATANVSAGQTFTPSNWSVDSGTTSTSYIAATIAFKK